jgi:hypothetical protein
MSNAEAEPVAEPVAVPASTDSTTENSQSEIRNPKSAIGMPGTYPMLKEGRRQSIILLLGVISIWVFALWSLIAMLPDGITGIEWVTGLLMLGILVVAPVVAWTLLEEANSRITTDDAGITYNTIGGISLVYSWADVAGFKDKGHKGRIARFFLGDDDGDNSKSNSNETKENTLAVKAGKDEDEETPPDDEPDTMLLTVRKELTTQIANPVVRFLHKQAHGNDLPIYGGLENRKALLSEISSHIST